MAGCREGNKVKFANNKSVEGIWLKIDSTDTIDRTKCDTSYVKDCYLINGTDTMRVIEQITCHTIKLKYK